MNKILKLFPVAAAALMLASCNSDDFFGDNNAKRVYNVPTIDVTVEDPAAATRANTTGEAWLIDWQAGDLLRVYDSNVQKYDKFEYDGNLFALANGTGDANVQYVNPYVGATEEENAYALFYGKNSDDGDANAVSYSGWKQGGEAGVPTALVYLPKDLLYAESKLSTDNTVSTYKTAMPLWGRVSAPAEGTEAQFSADLKWLTSYIRLRLENANKLLDPIVAVHVYSLAWGATTDADKNKFKALATADKKWKAFDADLTDGATKKINGLGAGKNLNGWFEAELKDGGQLVNTTDPAILQSDNADLQPGKIVARNEIEIDVTGLLEANENYLWIPIISGQKYDVLAITCELESGNEYIANVYFDYEAERASGKAIGVEFPNTNYILDGTTTAKITTGIKNTYDGNTSAVVIFNQADEGTLPSQFLTVSTGAASKNTIYLPQIGEKDLTIIIENIAGTGTTLNEDLTIADATGITEQGTGKVKIYINEFEDPTNAQKVIINSKADIELGGDFSNSTVDHEIFVETGDKTTNLTLGTKAYGAAAPFNYGTKTFTATKGNLVVDNTSDMSLIFNNAAGMLTTKCELENVTVTDAASATIKGEIGTKLSTAKNITIEAAKTDVIEELELEKTVSTITLKGGIINTISETATAAKQYAKDAPITLNSEGLSAIKVVNPFAKAVKWTFNSKLNVPTDGAATYYMTATNAADASETANIYTAAQLAGVANITAKDFLLKTNITELTNWQSPNLVKAFDGAKKLTNAAVQDGLTIAGVDAPLFGTVTANIDNVDLTCAFPATCKANGIGGLAKAAGAADIVVNNVKVAGQIYGSYNVGGIFGTTGANTVTIGANTKDVVVTAAFHNTTAYDSPYNGRTDRAGTFGTIIGQAGAGAVTLTNNKVSDAGATFDKAGLFFQYNRLPDAETGMNAWQFKGNTKFIGYSPAATSLTYGNKLYTNVWAEPTAVAYNAGTKVVTGTVRIINSAAALDAAWYTAKDDAFKTKMKATFAALAGVADDANWDAVVVEVHNLWEPFAK